MSGCLVAFVPWLVGAASSGFREAHPRAGRMPPSHRKVDMVRPLRFGVSLAGRSATVHAQVVEDKLHGIRQQRGGSSIPHLQSLPTKPSTPNDASSKVATRKAPPPPNPQWIKGFHPGRGGGVGVESRGPRLRPHGGKQRPRALPPPGQPGRPRFPQVP